MGIFIDLIFNVLAPLLFFIALTGFREKTHRATLEAIFKKLTPGVLVIGQSRLPRNTSTARYQRKKKREIFVANDALINIINLDKDNKGHNSFELGEEIK